MSILPKLRATRQVPPASEPVRDLVVEDAAGPIAAAIAQQSRLLADSDRDRFRVILLRENDTGGMSSWNLNAASANDIDNISKALASDVVKDAKAAGPGHYEAVVAARKVLQTVTFVVPFDIVESVPESNTVNAEHA